MSQSYRESFFCFFCLFVCLFLRLEHYVDQASLKVIETCLPLRVLGLKAYTTTGSFAVLLKGSSRPKLGKHRCGRPCPSPHSLCLANKQTNKQGYIPKASRRPNKVYSLIWPPPEDDHQGPAIKVLKFNYCISQGSLESQNCG